MAAVVQMGLDTLSNVVLLAGYTATVCASHCEAHIKPVPKYPKLQIWHQ